ncbi:phospholipase effector Tle1 domain-containing protein [Saccharopolyspora soli]|uniref:phospholipase effector Tle1 domain-containing protein n=1 Tax=Saccharopolyspora soli TaxID=2926618 RepID=UPI003556DA12
MCLDGTNNKIRAAGNTNVVRLFDLLDPTRQVAYYNSGVGTFSSPAAWTPVARSVFRLAGLAFGAGLRQSLAGARPHGGPCPRRPGPGCAHAGLGGQDRPQPGVQGLPARRCRDQQRTAVLLPAAEVS